VVEPIAGSTGVLVPPKGYLERLRQICDKNGILLVFDEVICGFGRTGKAFAAQSFAVVPDMITMAKALTNGAQPMGAVAVSERIYSTVVDNAAQGGSSFSTATPIRPIPRLVLPGLPPSISTSARGCSIAPPRCRLISSNACSPSRI
jgi:acetylornithine/succinyldiaminopimelate/putrescine aminotransferase